MNEKKSEKNRCVNILYYFPPVVLVCQEKLWDENHNLEIRPPIKARGNIEKPEKAPNDPKTNEKIDNRPNKDVVSDASPAFSTDHENRPTTNTCLK